jgi:hypothetical protein
MRFAESVTTDRLQSTANFRCVAAPPPMSHSGAGGRLGGFASYW